MTTINYFLCHLNEYSVQNQFKTILIDQMERTIQCPRGKILIDSTILNLPPYYNM